MIIVQRYLAGAAAAALLCASSATFASFSAPYSTSAAFQSATGASATDSFDDLASGELPGSLSRGTGTFGYTASAQLGLYGIGSTGDSQLSTFDHRDPLVFNGFSSAVYAVGGNFFSSDAAGTARSGQLVMITVTDVMNQSMTYQLTSAAPAGFFGVVSTNPLLSLVVTTDALIEFYPSVDNLVLASSVPEPGVLSMFCAGLFSMLAVARRKSAKA